jgi:hypothetical protein
MAMGREIRRVPAGWQHPRREGRNDLQPMFDRSFAKAAREWLDEAIAWDNGTDKDCAEHKAECPFYWQWNGEPPDPAYYRPDWKPEEMTHFQVYETVSEGTPVSPVFATREEVVAWLTAPGVVDRWGRNEQGKSRAVAERFVRGGWAPSMVSVDGVTATNVDALGLLPAD